MIGIAVTLVLVSFIDNCVNSQKKNIVFNVFFFDASNLPKSIEIERHAHSGLADYKSKNRYDKIIARRICSSFLVYLELNRSRLVMVIGLSGVKFGL